MLFRSAGLMKRQTIASLLAAAAGLLFYAMAGTNLTSTAAEIGESFLKIWTEAFGILVAPLVASMLFTTLAGDVGVHSARRVGIATVAVFVGLLVFTAAGTVVLTRAALELPWLRSLSLGVTPPVRAAAEAVGGAGNGWYLLQPVRLLAEAAHGDLVAVMVVTLIIEIGRAHV